MNDPHQPQPLSQEQIGERLRMAREKAAMTQAEAAGRVGIARTTLVAIESGHRRARQAEIRQLADVYDTSVNDLLRQEAVHADLVPRFRMLHDASEGAAARAARLLSDLASAEAELELVLGVRRSPSYPPERPISSGDLKAQANEDALELRQRLGLGLNPISDVVIRLELDLGMRVYVRPLDPRISGLFAYHDEIGACVLLNANHPKSRRNQTAAHECGHLVANRREPEILFRDEGSRTREEQYAAAFGRSFLTPARAVIAKFNELTAGSDRLTRRHVILLAHYFGVSREALVRRLEELKLTKRGTWDWFQANGGITDQHARQVLGDIVPEEEVAEAATNPSSIRLNLLAAEAYRQELMSEGQLCRLLHLDRVSLRALVDGIEADGREENGLAQLSN